MDKKKRKDRSKRITVAVIGACLILLVAYLIFSRAGTNVIESNNEETDNLAEEKDNSSGNCPVSSAGIPLCELSPEQREREELKDRLNLELSRMQNGSEDADPYAPVKKPSGGVIISPTSSVRLKVLIPGSDHASLVAEDLKNLAGVSDVYWSPPNLYDIKYDAKRTSVGEILGRDIFKRYNASVVSSV
jgi:hypothetical protein